MGQTIVQVDAFTDRPFAGNPAAVCVLPGPADEGWMRDVAREMNLSETAFLFRVADGFKLRWFTPKVEVPLCGHATLASAHVLWEDGHPRPEEQARFHTKCGLLTANRRDNLIELDFPADPVMLVEAPPELNRAIGAPAVNIVRGAIRLRRARRDGGQRRPGALVRPLVDRALSQCAAGGGRIGNVDTIAGLTGWSRLEVKRGVRHNARRWVRLP
ncbi:MAG: PhzF family phenazine biosynthesis protein [Chloroflexi bacterium]|nr:PhzF family phenazine biosynthesis protein [Chloroflexota bacterium]